MNGHLRNHVFPAEHFQRLAEGGGDAKAMSVLLSAELSRRLLLLRELLDCAGERPEILGPLPPADAAWQALERLDQDPRSAAAFRDTLMHPQFGTWIARVLRLVATTTDGTPTWVEAGQLHSAIFAVALRSGVKFSGRLPVRRGYVLLPTLGVARVPATGEWGVATAESNGAEAWLTVDGTRYRLPSPLDVETAQWWPLRRIRPVGDPPEFGTWLDDIDFYRDLADPVLPDRLDSADVARWEILVEDAWRIITAALPESAAAMSSGLTSIVPLPSDGTQETRSASTGDAFGAAMISMPPDALTLAVSMVHEFQHIKLGGVLHLTSLYESGPDAGTLVYAPWRDDPRPLAGLLQGTYAFLGIAQLWREYRRICPLEEFALAEFEFAYSRRQAWAAMRTIIDSSWLNERGRRFAAGMAHTLRAHLAEPISPDSARAAWAAAVEHRSAWRLRHLHCDTDQVERLAAAFAHGCGPDGAIPVPRALIPGSGNYWQRGRLGLHRVKLVDPRRFRRLMVENAPTSGASVEDLLLVGGDDASALSGYAATVEADPDAVDAWTGLSLAMAERRRPGWRSLTRRPELVRATYVAARRQGRDEPVAAVAAWLDRLGPAAG